MNLHTCLLLLFLFPLECIYNPLNYFQKQGRKKTKLPGISEGKKNPTDQHSKRKTSYHFSIAKHVRFLCFPTQNILFWGLSSFCGAPCKTIPSDPSNKEFHMGKRKKVVMFKACDGQAIWAQLCHKIHIHTPADNLLWARLICSHQEAFNKSRNEAPNPPVDFL